MTNSYNDGGGPVSNSYVMKVSSNGQVSIPAQARARWMAERVVVVDLGDRVVMRPMTDDAVGALVGKYRGRGPSATAARAAEREGSVRADARKRR